ncbi:MAG: glycosyltransferase family 4 protein [Candidatus Hadarchaeales archaeon]
MRFLFLNPDFPYKQNDQIIITGGLQAHGFFIARELVKRGHEVTAIAFLPEGGTEVIDGIRVCRVGNWTTEHSMFKKTFNFGKNLMELLRAGMFIAEEYKPDFIYSWSSEGFIISPVISKLYKIPFIASIHGIGGLNVLFYGFFLNKGAYACPTSLGELVLATLGSRMADLVETISTESKKLIIDFVGIDARKIFVTGNGVNIEDYEYSEDKENLIVVLGRLTRVKRVDRAIEIFRRVKEKVKDAKLCIIGDGPEKELLMRMTKNEPDIIFTGIIPEKEKISLLKRAKIYLSSSSYESWNIPLLEAWACGAYPVVPHIPALVNIVGPYGFVYKEESEAVRAITHMLIQENERRKCTYAARKFVEENYDWKKIADKFISAVASWDSKR